MRKMTLLILSLLLLVNGLTISVLAQNQSKEIFIPKVDYSHFKLDNGLQIYVFEDHKVPLVNFSAWYKVGSIDEPEGISGISHLLEHMMFLGTETLDKNQIHKLVKSAGGVNNAGTNYDYTQYYEELPSAKLELAMAIESDRMRNLNINPQEFKREKKVVKQERRKRVENNIFQSSLEKVQAKAFPNSPLKHQIIGWRKDLNQITVEDIRDYYHRYYAPNNAVLAVSGDVNPKEVYQLAKKYYGDYKPQPVKRLKRIEDKQTEERTITLEKITKVPFIEMMYKIPAGDHRDLVAIQALLEILVNNSTSRIKNELKQKKSLILQTGGFTVALRRPAFAMIYTIPMSEKVIDQVQTAFDQELKKLIEQGITDEELKIVKKSALKSIIKSQKHTSTAARRIIKDVVRYNDPQLYQKKIKWLNNLTKEDIIRVAKKYFKKDNRTVGYVVPKK
ncbi:pitrilysin family protein [Halanaerocella petrolearia]